jgi:hypothetical protein
MFNAFQFKGKVVEYFYSHSDCIFFYIDQYYTVGHANYIYVLCCNYECQNTELYISYSLL